jgi:predicted metal-dependent phosphoesterase TrpH
MTVNFASATKPKTNNVSTLKPVLQRIDIDSCPKSYNFHLHTVYSDGKLHPQELIAQAIAIGLKGFAITDHHSAQGYYKAKNELDHWKFHHPEEMTMAPNLWTGIEINANLLNVEVHILGYDFDPQHPSLKPYLEGKAARGDAYQGDHVIDAIHNAGGLAVLAHPCRYRQSPEKLIPEAARLGIDGVETYYAYGNPTPWCPSAKQTAQVKSLTDTFDLLNTCGTDTHGLNILERL